VLAGCDFPFPIQRFDDQEPHISDSAFSGHSFWSQANIRLYMQAAWPAILGIVVASCAGAGDTPFPGIAIPTGQMVTPTAARGAIFQDLNPGRAAAPDMRAGQATAVSILPDGRTLAILTSGFNVYYGRNGKAVPELSTEYIFLYDVTGPQPKQEQGNGESGFLRARSHRPGCI
jgi:hypothetical protein